jgi:hypothetical protein
MNADQLIRARLDEEDTPAAKPKKPGKISPVKPDHYKYSGFDPAHVGLRAAMVDTWNGPQKKYEVHYKGEHIGHVHKEVHNDPVMGGRLRVGSTNTTRWHANAHGWKPYEGHSDSVISRKTDIGYRHSSQQRAVEALVNFYQKKFPDK